MAAQEERTEGIAVPLERRPLPDQLRFLARKLSAGTSPETVAVTLQVIADEMSDAASAALLSLAVEFEGRAEISDETYRECWRNAALWARRRTHASATEPAAVSPVSGDSTEGQSAPGAFQGGAGLIAAERLRQTTQEGWTPEHDSHHAPGDLALAAVAYIVHTASRGDRPWQQWDAWWPWEEDGFKPGYHVRNLVKAGALVAAEIDRMTASGDGGEAHRAPEGRAR